MVEPLPKNSRFLNNAVCAIIGIDSASLNGIGGGMDTCRLQMERSDVTCTAVQSPIAADSILYASADDNILYTTADVHIPASIGG